MTSCRAVFASSILFLINLFFVALALCVVVIALQMGGAAAPDQADDEQNLLFDWFSWNALALVLLMGGFLMLLISTVGFSAALCESRVLLNIYVTLVSVCFGALVMVGVVGWLYSDIVSKEASALFVKLAAKYRTNPDAAYLVQKLQASAYCCGNESPDFWHEQSPLGEEPFNHTLPAGKYPASCCDDSVWLVTSALNETFGELCNVSQLLYHDGCFARAQLSRYGFFSMCIFIKLLFLLLLLISLSCCIGADGELDECALINLKYSAHLHKCPVIRAMRPYTGSASGAGYQPRLLPPPSYTGGSVVQGYGTGGGGYQSRQATAAPSNGATYARSHQ